ncbi:Coenzyme PQQ synthesis protein D (PqqD) [Rivularia sp. PCC 7116]|uniref:PqqD family protein n=1 Tax=Rivularia sp. PCC 7116 TaxID=373994 RepID=UPI00029F108E|nr:PqqD family protein [Rivularia sp. PCC 7116]AFY57877.1 Coenzyme PQQ synthesis protein D (PqqD) [Rivularia sp. PCC 7116]
MSQFSLEQKILTAPNVLAQDLAGESVLLNIKTEQYFSLDDIGTRMWQTLIEKDSIQSAIDALQVEYQVEPELLQKDVKNLIEELLANELVEVSNS